MPNHDHRVHPPTRATVLVAEDEWLVARHIEACLQAAGFEVLAPVHSARAAVELALRANPDVIVMDVKLDGDLDGISAAHEIGRHQRTPVVYLTAHTDRDTVARAARSHAASYILKPFVERQLVSAVLLASYQRTATSELSDGGLEQTIRAIVSVVNDTGAPRAERKPATPANDVANRLSPRERELVDMLARGARLSGVARNLGLSTHTVRNHLKSVFRKLDIHSQHDLVEFWRSQPGSAPH